MVTDNNYQQIIIEFYKNFSDNNAFFRVSKEELLKNCILLEYLQKEKISEILAIGGLRKQNKLFLIVKKEYRNKGLGSELLKKIIRSAIENGIHYIQLTAFEENMHAIHLYQKAGFLPAGKLSVDQQQSVLMVLPFSFYGKIFFCASKIKLIIFHFVKKCLLRQG
jgi:ribosomal-protein-alanine N-acetyltransferase